MGGSVSFTVYANDSTFVIFQCLIAVDFFREYPVSFLHPDLTP